MSTKIRLTRVQRNYLAAVRDEGAESAWRLIGYVNGGRGAFRTVNALRRKGLLDGYGHLLDITDLGRETLG